MTPESSAAEQAARPRLALAPDPSPADALRIVRIGDIVDAVSGYIENPDLDLIYKAYVYSARVHQGHQRANGEPYLNHPLWVAWLLTQLNADEPTIAAGLLHDTVEDTWATVEDIEENFGPVVTQLVDAVTKLSKIEYRSKTQRQIESYRKMLVATARDLRVILIKLADRLHNMRTLEFLPNAKQVAIARETMDLYAPLAGRLGMHTMRAELEDLSFRYLEPETWAELNAALEARREADAEAIKETVAALQETVKACGVEADISGRQKHLYSIWRKMQKRHVELDQVFDMIAFRIIVPEVRDCYTVLGEVHARWTPIPGRIKDYIAMPKANRYQSLHTTVIGPRGKPIEVQIRTQEMHRVAELGVAAHWAYKEGGAATDPSRAPFSWLRELYELHGAVRDSEQFVESVRLDLFQDEVYVFTPNGDMIELPSGATPLDFAYKIHTEVGHRTRGAKVDGKMVPLSTPLRSGQIVEILTGKENAPRRDWLKIARTSAARQKIRAYLNRRDREQALTLGRSLLVQAFKEAGLDQDPDGWLGSPQGRQALADLKMRDADHLVEALGYGRLTLPRVKEIIERRAGLRKPSEPRFLAPLERLWRRSPATRDAPLIVDGQSNIATSIAQCCRPLPGDDVVGYVRVGRGIRIHRADCPRVETANPDRIIPAEWGRTEGDERQIVQLDLECVDTPGVLARIGHAVSAQKVNIVETTFRATGDGRAEGTVKVAVRNRKELDRVVAELGKLKGVMEVRRH